MGRRGEGWVVGQAVLLILVALAPPSPTLSRYESLSPLGFALLALGGLLGLGAVRQLGRNLTPLPMPRDDGELVESGLYRLVRHPIYLSLLVAALGWALFRQSALGVVLTLLLAVFFDAKAHREEQWLRERYPAYADYQRRVRRLIPWLY